MSTSLSGSIVGNLWSPGVGKTSPVSLLSADGFPCQGFCIIDLLKMEAFYQS
jgi:hypothetical protein